MCKILEFTFGKLNSNFRHDATLHMLQNSTLRCKVDLFVVIQLKHNIFTDYQMWEGHTPRTRSNKQYGAL